VEIFYIIVMIKAFLAFMGGMWVGEKVNRQPRRFTEQNSPRLRIGAGWDPPGPFSG